MKITEGPLTAISGWPRCMKVKRAYNSRNRHLPEWRFLPFMRIVTVSPKIWNVSVIGISTSPLSERRRPNRPSLCWGPGVSSETGFILPIPSVSVNSKIPGTQKIAFPPGRAYLTSSRDLL